MTAERPDAHTVARPESWWLKMFEQYDVKYLALDPDEDRRLIQFLTGRPEWTLDFWDRDGVLFVRSDVLQAQPTLAA